MHVAAAVVPARVQVVNVPVTPASLNATVPVGVRKVPAAEVSATVTVQVEAWLITTGVLQLTVVAVVRGLTIMLAVPLLEELLVSPGNEAVTAAVPEVDAVNVEVHVAVDPLPLRVQVVNVPVTPVSDRATVPVGVELVVDVTVTVHVEPWFTTTGVMQLTLVVLCPWRTTTVVLPLLPE